jgi:ABC-type oligopeptide transport system substrate-binding subunit
MSSQEALRAYDEGRVDAAYPYQRSVEEGNRAIQRHPDDYVSSPNGGTGLLFFDTRKPPFDDRRLRQAIALATDRENVVSEATRGTFLPALGGMVPPGMPGHVANIGLPFDPGLARQKAAEAGYRSGSDWPDLELVVSIGHNRGGMWHMFAEQWLEYLNLTVQVVESDFNSVLDIQVRAPMEMMVMGWTADYPDPDSFLRVASWLPSGGWRHAKYEALIEGARRITDRRQRLAMYRQAELLLVDEAPVIPVAYGLDHLLIKPWFDPWPKNQNSYIIKDVVMQEH